MLEWKGDDYPITATCEVVGADGYPFELTLEIRKPAHNDYDVYANEEWRGSAKTLEGAKHKAEEVAELR